MTSYRDDRLTRLYRGEVRPFARVRVAMSQEACDAHNMTRIRANRPESAQKRMNKSIRGYCRWSVDPTPPATSKLPRMPATSRPVKASHTSQNVVILDDQLCKIMGGRQLCKEEELTRARLLSYLREKGELAETEVKGEVASFGFERDTARGRNLMCTQCRVVIERDADWYEKQWCRGGDIMLNIVKEHSELYPHFLASLLQFLETAFKMIFDQDPQRLERMLSTETKGLLASRATSEDPALLQSVFDSVNSEKLIELLRSRGDLLGDMLDENPDLLSVLSEEKPEQLQQALKGLLESVDGKEMLRDRANELLAQEPWKLDLEVIQNAVKNGSPLLARNLMYAACSSLDIPQMTTKFEDCPVDDRKGYDAQVAPLTDEESPASDRHSKLLHGSGACNLNMLQGILAEREMLEPMFAASAPELEQFLVDDALNKNPQDGSGGEGSDGNSTLLSAVVATCAQDEDYIHKLIEATPGLQAHIKKHGDECAAKALAASTGRIEFTVVGGAGQQPRTFNASDVGLVKSDCDSDSQFQVEVVEGPSKGKYGGEVVMVRDTKNKEQVDLTKYRGTEAVANAQDGSATTTSCLVDLLERDNDDFHDALHLAASVQDESACARFRAVLKEFLGAGDQKDLLGELFGQAVLDHTCLLKLCERDATQCLPAMSLVAASGVCGGRFWEDVSDLMVMNQRQPKEHSAPMFCPKCNGAMSEGGGGETGGQKQRLESDGKYDVWKRQLSGNFSSKDPAMSLQRLQLMIYEIYESHAEWTGSAEQVTLQEFVTDFLLIKWGTKAMVKKKLRVLVKSLVTHLPHDRFVSSFAEFVGVEEILPEGYAVRGERQLDTYMWAMQHVLKNRKALKLKMCNNDKTLRMLVEKHGGKAVIGIVHYEAAEKLLKRMVTSFGAAIDTDALLRDFAAASFKLPDRMSQPKTCVSIEAMLSHFLRAGDMHREAERKRIEELFVLTDEDGSGTLDYDEFKSLIANLPSLTHLTEFSITRMFNSSDSDGQGGLDLEEFIQLAQGELKNILSASIMTDIEASMGDKQASYNQMMADYIMSIFKRWDSAEDGSIPVEDFPALMESIGFSMSANEAAGVVRIIDKDGDGGIDSGEFLDWWQEYAMEQIFLKHDSDGSGELDKDELKGLMQELGIEWETEEQYDEIFREVDVDGGEAVSFAELLQWFSVFDAKQVFLKYDGDGSGTLGADELHQVLTDLGVPVTPEFLEDAIEKLDDDGSGELSFDEFMPWWTAEQRKRKNERLAASRVAHGRTHRRASEQLELSLKDNAYLKMSAQRERNLIQSQDHLRSVLTAIAADFAVHDVEAFMDKYFVTTAVGTNDSLLKSNRILSAQK